MENWTDLQGNSLNDFYNNYRQALEEQRDAGVAQVEQERKNQQANIMSASNARGLMYSNIPARNKIYYDTNTYYPALTSVNTTYQTGLDTLRNNMVSYYNQIDELKKNIANLNKLYS